jgi:glucokinase
VLDEKLKGDREDGIFGKLLELQTQPTQSADLPSTLESLIASATKRHKIEFIGVSFAGQISDSTIVAAPNIALGALKNADFSQWARSRFCLPASIDNDLKCALRAEAASRGFEGSTFALYIGTGIGGAFMQQSALLRGDRNLAGEIGHIPFEKTPFLCGCGGSDCLESSASGSGIAKWSEFYGLKERALSELNASNDPKAKEIVSRFYRGVDHAVKTIVALFNPSEIVLGGGIAMSEKEVLPRAQRAARDAFKPAACAKVELSALGDCANLLGASLLDRAHSI